MAELASVTRQHAGGLAEDWLSLGPASRFVGVDPDTLRRWADAGRVRAFSTPGGHRRFARSDLARLQRQRPRSRSPLSSLGATPERVARAYVRSYRSGPELATIREVAGPEREAFRADGRLLVEALLAYLDTQDPAARAAREADATALVRSTAVRLAAAGMDVAAAVSIFVAARRPFLDQLEAIGRRRSLEAPAITSAYAEATALLDRLLLAFIDAFSHTT